jgi:hypothetical protein
MARIFASPTSVAITAAPAIVSVHSAGGHLSQTVASLNQRSAA